MLSSALSVRFSGERSFAVPIDEPLAVTGAARGVGRAIAEHLTRDGHVVALDRDGEALAWTEQRADIDGVAGDGMDEAALTEAVDRAARAGTLSGWVNNAAVFRDAALHDTPVADVLELITANLGPAVAGSAAAIRRSLEDGTAGAVVNVSSHRAQRAEPGVPAGRCSPRRYCDVAVDEDSRVCLTCGGLPRAD